MHFKQGKCLLHAFENQNTSVAPEVKHLRRSGNQKEGDTSASLNQKNIIDDIFGTTGVR